jgi:hypothetical protein
MKDNETKTEYSVRFVHKVSSRPQDADGTHVWLTPADLANKNALAKALRDQRALVPGARVREYRVQGNGACVVAFPVLPGLTTYWHSLLLFRVAA